MSTTTTHPERAIIAAQAKAAYEAAADQYAKNQSASAFNRLTSAMLALQQAGELVRAAPERAEAFEGMANRALRNAASWDPSPLEVVLNGA